MKSNKLSIQLTLVISVFVSLISCQSGQYKMEWKIAEGDPVYYKAEMKALESKLDGLDSLFGKDQTLKGAYDEIQNEMKHVNQYAVMQNRNDTIDVQMVMYTPEDIKSKNHMTQLLTELNGQVVLRGTIDKTGRLIGNFLATKQENLLSIMFELPKNKVAIGEEWELDVDFIEMGNGFILEKSTNKNVVRLKKVVQKGNSSLAVIEYDIFNSVEGNMKNGFGKGLKEVSISMGLNAIAQFNITHGRWETFKGILSMKQHSFIDIDTKQSIKLINVDSVPEQVLASIGLEQDFTIARTIGKLQKKVKKAIEENIDTVQKEETRLVNLETKTNYIYKVQLKSSKTKIALNTKEFLRAGEKVSEHIKKDEVYKFKYTVGILSDETKARELRAKMKKLGFSGAFVIKTENKAPSN